MSAQDRALAREKLLFDELVTALAPAIPALQRAAAALATLDVLMTLAERADALNLVRPEFDSTPGLAIRAGRHPVVEGQIDEFIPNDLDLAPDRRLLIVTGPNMGGKSTYMRQAAVIALLAHCGSFVPAASADRTLDDRRASARRRSSGRRRYGRDDDYSGDGRATPQSSC